MFRRKYFSYIFKHNKRSKYTSAKVKKYKNFIQCSTHIEEVYSFLLEMRSIQRRFTKHLRNLYQSTILYNGLTLSLYNN